MYTLNNFYRSKQWCLLVQQIRHDRLNDEGQIICEHCGKPIVKEYDCIGHHKIYLTEDNVNDIDISLNPDNIALVHHRCHNKIHNKLGYKERKVYLIYGSPLSGKSSWVRDNANEGDLIVDMNNIWMCVSGCNRYVKPNRLRANVFGIRDKLLEDVKYRRGKWLNAYIIGGYPLSSERERMIKELGAEAIYIDTSQEECLLRLEDKVRLDGRDPKEWKKYIDDWWKKFEGKF